MKRLLSLLLLSAGLYAADPAYYLDRFSEQSEKVRDLKVQIHLKSRLPGLTIPDRQGTLYFKRPDKLHLEGEGFMMLPREAFMPDLRSMVDSTVEMKQLALPDSVTDAQLILEFRRIIDNQVFTTVAMLDTLQWTLRRLQISEGRQFESRVEFTYTDIDGLQLPAVITVYIDNARFQNRNVRNPRGPRGRGRANEGQQGYMEIRFSGYAVNGGLEDALFPEKDSEAEED